MGPRPGVPAIVPSYGSMLRHLLPSTGSRWGRFPRFCATTRCSHSSPPRPLRPRPAALRCLRLAVPRVRRFFAPADERRDRRRAWALVFGPPTDSLARRRSGLPGSWGNPPACMPCSSTPTGSRRPATRRLDAAFRTVNGVGSRNDQTHGAPSPGLHAPCVRFAARITPPPRNTRFRLAAHLCRVGLATHWVPHEGFLPSSILHGVPPPQAFPGAMTGAVTAGGEAPL